MEYECPLIQMMQKLTIMLQNSVGAIFKLFFPTGFLKKSIGIQQPGKWMAIDEISF